MWDAAFTIQAAYRRMKLRRRRRARALKRAMGASNAAAAWPQGLEQGEEKAGAGAAAREKELDGGNGNDDVEGLATSGGGPGRRTDSGQLGSVVAASPPAHAGNGNTTSASGVDEGNRPGGQGPASDVSANAPYAAAPTDPEFEDLGDIAFAAVRMARNPAPSASPLPAMPGPAVAVQEPATQTVVGAKSVSAPLQQEETLEYYEAKMRYLAAQEKAHGASAFKIQASNSLFCMWFRSELGALSRASSQPKHPSQKITVIITELAGASGRVVRALNR